MSTVTAWMYCLIQFGATASFHSGSLVFVSLNVLAVHFRNCLSCKQPADWASSYNLKALSLKPKVPPARKHIKARSVMSKPTVLPRIFDFGTRAARFSSSSIASVGVSAFEAIRKFDSAFVDLCNLNNFVCDSVNLIAPGSALCKLPVGLFSNFSFSFSSAIFFIRSNFTAGSVWECGSGAMHLRHTGCNICCIGVPLQGSPQPFQGHISCLTDTGCPCMQCFFPGGTHAEHASRIQLSGVGEQLPENCSAWTVVYPSKRFSNFISDSLLYWRTWDTELFVCWCARLVAVTFAMLFSSWASLSFSRFVASVDCCCLEVRSSSSCISGEMSASLAAWRMDLSTGDWCGARLCFQWESSWACLFSSHASNSSLVVPSISLASASASHLANRSNEPCSSMTALALWSFSPAAGWVASRVGVRASEAPPSRSSITASSLSCSVPSRLGE